MVQRRIDICLVPNLYFSIFSISIITNDDINKIHLVRICDLYNRSSAILVCRYVRVIKIHQVDLVTFLTISIISGVALLLSNKSVIIAIFL